MIMVEKFNIGKFRPLDGLLPPRKKDDEKSGALLYPEKSDDKKLDELLQMEYEKMTQYLPKIEYEFNPEIEVKKILRSENKRKALEDFKTKLSTQREAISECGLFLKRKIRNNPNIGRGELTIWIERFSRDYKFTDRQKLEFEIILERFWERRREMMMLRKDYPNDRDLMAKLLEKEIPGDVKFYIEEGIYSFNVYPEDNHSFSFLMGIKDSIINQYTGFAHDKFIVFEKRKRKELSLLSRIFNFLDLQSTKKHLDLQSTKKHEEQHIENRVITDFDNFKHHKEHREGSRLLWRRIFREEESLIKVNIENYLEHELNHALNRFRDEIFAIIFGIKMLFSFEKYLINCLFIVEKINWDNLRDSFSGKGMYFYADSSNAYDYLSYLKKYDIPDQGKIKDIFDELKRKIIIEEYNNIVRDATDAVFQLHKKGYSSSKIIYLLADKSPRRWKREIDRIV